VHTFLVGKYMPKGEVMEIPPHEAEQALAEIQARRERVIDANLVPNWFWWAIGGLLLPFVAAMETQRPWLMITGAVGYLLGMALLILAMVRRSRLQVQNQLIGVRGGLVITAFTLVLSGGGIALGLWLDSLGVPAPNTLGCVPVAAVIAVGGPALMSYLRKLMLSDPMARPR
jgi:hypothetical protein